MEGELPSAWKTLRGRDEVFKGILMIMKGTGLIGQETTVLFFQSQKENNEAVA